MEVLQQHFFDLSLNYNLRNPKSKRPTIIYAVFRIAGKQYKINIGAKVYPNQWDSRLQMPIIHNISNLDVYNNNIVLSQINQTKLVFDKAKSYICNNPHELEYPKRCLEIIKQNFNLKPYTMKNRDSIIQWLMEYIEVNKRGNTLVKELQNVNFLKRFFKEHTQYQDDFAQISFEMINDAFRYMEQMTMPNGKQYAISTIREAQKKLKAALKVAAGREYRKFNWQATEIDEVQITKNLIPKPERGAKNAPLAADEIASLRAYECSGSSVVARDLFLIQCYTGQRKSDLMQLLDSNNIDWDKGIITVNRQVKGKQAAYIPIKDILLVQLIKKYEGQLHRLPVKYNDNLRKVAKNVGLTRVVEYTEQRGKVVKEHKGHIYELIHNHLGRHTFISRMAEAGASKDEIKSITGHTCDSTVDDIYTHIDQMKAAQKGAEHQNGLYDTMKVDEASCPKNEPVSNNGISDDMVDRVVDLKIQCRDLRRKNLELSSILNRQEYEEAMETIEMLPPTEEDFMIHTV